MNTTIHLTDNNADGVIIQREHIADIMQIAQLGRLQDAPNLLVFPHSFSEMKDGIGELSILTTKDHKIDASGIVSLKACTSNLMGFVGVNHTSVSIHSRFTHKKIDGCVDDSAPDFFLYYMLQKVFSINIFNLDHSSNTDDKILDFLLFLFPYMLKKAFTQGIYKEYYSYQFDDARVRGTIDMNNFIKRDMPFRGAVSYRTREHSYDNNITQLIRHTIEFIRKQPIGSSILSCDNDTINAVSQIMTATPTFATNNRTRILNANRKPKVHPYYINYMDLQQLCIRILRHDSLKYGSNNETIHGILFDGAWLWEEYLYTILKEHGFFHPKNKEAVGGIRMFANDIDEVYLSSNHRKMYPDFYRKDYILDAKYKHLNGNVGRDDLYQVVSYMYCMHSAFGGYLYPDDSCHTPKSYKLNGFGQNYDPPKSGGILSVIPFYIPQNAIDWSAFQREMEKSKDDLVQILNS